MLYPSFDHMFLADQSSGHTHKHHNGGCDITRINSGFGGKQAIVKYSTVCAGDYGQPYSMEGRYDLNVDFKHWYPCLEDCGACDGWSFLDEP